MGGVAQFHLRYTFFCPSEIHRSSAAERCSRERLAAKRRRGNFHAGSLCRHDQIGRGKADIGFCWQEIRENHDRFFAATLALSGLRRSFAAILSIFIAGGSGGWRRDLSGS